jgi:DNA polymerase-3 subunit delta'
MLINDYLKKYQPIAYKVFSNAVITNKISHAYLLVGESGIPLKEVALFFAKSILCDNPSPLACEKCLTCQRIENNDYPDVLLFDGKERTIKKEDIDTITSNFSRTALEEKGKTIYIINLVENMTTEAVNSLLKFLEEPGKDTYAILTTENESKVLPTIISRVQSIRLILIDKKTIIEEAKSIGVPDEDAELLSSFYNNAELIKEKFNDKFYQNIKEEIFNMLKQLLDDRFMTIEYADERIIPIIKSKEQARVFFDILTIIFQDIINASINNSLILKSYDTIIIALSNKLTHIDKSLLAIMSARTQLDLNLNIPLLINKVMNVITKE